MTDDTPAITHDVTADMDRDRVFTRRNYLVYQQVIEGKDSLEAIEAIDKLAEEQPDLDMDEELTWEQWEQQK